MSPVAGRVVGRDVWRPGSGAVAGWGAWTSGSSFLTLAVRDLDASRAFYCDGLGWVADLDVPGRC